MSKPSKEQITALANKLRARKKVADEERRRLEAALGAGLGHMMLASLAGYTMGKIMQRRPESGHAEPEGVFIDVEATEKHDCKALPGAE